LKIFSLPLSSLKIFIYGVIVLFCVSLPYILPSYYISILCYGLVFGIASLGFTFLFKNVGLLSLGHAAYFAVGAYSVALFMKYFSIHSIELLLMISIFSSLLLSAIYGFLCVRHTQVYFALLSLALAQLIWVAINKFYFITYGADGIHVARPTIFGMNFSWIGSTEFIAKVFYYYILAILLVLVGVTWIIINSPFGRSLQAIRDNEVRAKFIGIKVRLYKWYAFLFSGTITGISGALYAVLNNHVVPEIANWTFSGEIIIISLLGGLDYLIGPVAGGIIYSFMRIYIWGITIYWKLLLGIVLLTILFLIPGGLISVIHKIMRAQIIFYHHSKRPNTSSLNPKRKMKSNLATT